MPASSGPPTGSTAHTHPLDHDVIIVGAGIGGLYALYRLREAGFDAVACEASDGLGGTWYRNRYPGCRFDSESYSYGYSFSQEVLDEWSWSQTFAPQPETLKYLNWVADRMDLRGQIRLNSRVEAASFDESTESWTVTLAGGEQMTARFLVTALGALSAPTTPTYEGSESFSGRSFHTIEWPDDLDVSGKKVAVIGVGSSGVQVISEIADQVEELTVFQREPGWCAPLSNSLIDDERMEQIRSSYADIFRRCRESPSGFIHKSINQKTLETPEAERLGTWEELYKAPGMGIWLANYKDTLMKEDANKALSEFVANKIRARVTDPEVAEKLVPKNHGFGTRRVALETGYYEAFNQPNVHLVDLRETPITRLVPSGVETTERVYDVDVIVYATGFDAFTGPYDRIDIRGRGGQRLKDKWADGPITTFGFQVHGYPNLMMLGGPQGGSGSTNVPRGLEEIVDWASDLLSFMRDRGYTCVEPSAKAEQAWVQHVQDVSSLLLMSRTKSWFTGFNANLPNRTKPRFLVYAAGNVRYRQHLQDEQASEYASFEFAS